MYFKKNLLVILAVAIGIVASIALRSFFDGNKRKIAWKVVVPQIEIAQDEATKAIEKRTLEVRAFFDERQNRISVYAERVLSFRSKWELGKSKIPGADKDEHTKFLRKEFAEIVFSDAELSQAVTGATENFVRDIKTIENALLVKIRADLQNMPECATVLPILKTDLLFQEQFANHILSLSSVATKDLKMNIGQFIGSEIAAVIAIRVGTAVATRLGVSATIVGTGTTMGPATFGASVIAGILIDQIAGWVIGWFYDPKAEISRTLSTELSNLSKLIVDGDEQTRGLKAELTELSEQRKKLRSNALQKMILQP